MLQLWDASGHERFGNIIAPYYKTCNGVVVVYDVTDKRWANRQAARQTNRQVDRQTDGQAGI